ncbi:MAG TPA: hypothetical protein VM717_04985 [Chthoniobacterales bacterium]|nr:hypothetical protein [Chthoniobacterales bacterium]
MRELDQYLPSRSNDLVNGATGKIEIIKPFEESFEVTKRILFQPFVFEKWLIIGFAALLSGHFGGGGFNFPFGNFPPRRAKQNFVFPDWEQWKPWLPIAIAVFGFFMLVLIVLFLWLRARGNFIFTDCIARNRAAIAEPWREYRQEGNSYFLFLSLVVFGSMAVFGLFCLSVLVPLGIFGQGVSISDTMTPLFIILFALLFLAWICFVFFFGVTSYFMVPLMYVRRLRAVEAFRQVATLLLEDPGPFILFCLFGICLLIATAMIAGIATCATCCIAALPYVGTVILLPVYVCLRAFGLRFIRQFGPDYDVWAVVSNPPPVKATEPPPLPS